MNPLTFAHYGLLFLALMQTMKNKLIALLALLITLPVNGAAFGKTTYKIVSETDVKKVPSGACDEAQNLKFYELIDTISNTSNYPVSARWVEDITYNGTCQTATECGTHGITRARYWVEEWQNDALFPGSIYWYADKVPEYKLTHWNGTQVVCDISTDEKIFSRPYGQNFHYYLGLWGGKNPERISGSTSGATSTYITTRHATTIESFPVLIEWRTFSSATVRIYFHARYEVSIHPGYMIPFASFFSKRVTEFPYEITNQAHVSAKINGAPVTVHKSTGAPNQFWCETTMDLTNPTLWANGISFEVHPTSSTPGNGTAKLIGWEQSSVDALPNIP